MTYESEFMLIAVGIFILGMVVGYILAVVVRNATLKSVGIKPSALKKTLESSTDED